MMPSVAGWLLCGGEGRRMGHQDKGLIAMHGEPLASRLLARLAPQVDSITINANRNQDRYKDLMRQHGLPACVLGDDTDLGSFQGPLAGFVTALRHTDAELLMCASCDTPHLPTDLVQRLREAQQAQDLDVVVPVTIEPDGSTRHHWVCVLIHRRCQASLEADVRNGERRVGVWIQRQRWIGVSFPDPSAFLNVNTPEVLHGQA
ncbi:molybdenum cofactor guanylyltransferase MobA [Aquabacterium sp.]|uniref:molybdenum cofactor guanylyltransferase MobA n=1 Tax=Aquabacterium sp. TaxID=1872578 RepID=UPI0035B3420E